MKNSNLKIFFLLIFSFTISNTFAQEKPKAVLIDNFGLLDCEDIWARMDSFTNTIHSSPDSVGYAVIYGKRSAVRENLSRERLIAGVLATRGLGNDRFKIIRAKESDEPHTEFWLVPSGADTPDFEEVKWNLTLPKNQKPFVYYAQNWNILCPVAKVTEIYAEYLTADPKVRANIAIFAISNAEFQKQKTEFSKDLIEKQKIPASRVRFFFAKVKPNLENYELWLLP